MHPKTREIILWEHFGLAEKRDYQRTIEFKLDKYLQAGYLPGHNLILTFEDTPRPLSFIEVEEIVKKHFSWNGVSVFCIRKVKKSAYICKELGRASLNCMILHGETRDLFLYL